MLDFVRLDFLPLRFVDLWHGVSPYHHQWKIRVCGGDFRRISSWIAKIILIRRGGTGNWSRDLARFSTGDKDLDGILCFYLSISLCNSIQCALFS
ncbi:uncharacterized protein LOC126588744 isoform X2 [Malus sylvestris]|uniref:uncharacterized protein LOC126588744 isoform X2 n=1 Tax=Malus sylvestris TaxID=3752 RepID=UPI0010AA63B2|nr:uncharacterized protein LOC103422034 isoform X2 [Malus domestica]XP_050109808.1 uncharacterized protein LOC126588744 isoform X2 [Malus sylvestris]